MKYKVCIDTSKYHSKEREKMSDQLINDWIEKLNGVSWQYKTISGVIKRIKVLWGVEATKETMVLTHLKYGERREKVVLPGVPTGYVDIDNILPRKGEKPTPSGVGWIAHT